MQGSFLSLGRSYIEQNMPLHYCTNWGYFVCVNAAIQDISNTLSNQAVKIDVPVRVFS